VDGDRDGGGALNPYWLVAIPLAWLAGYLVGQDAGRDAERKRVNYGMNIALSLLSSKALYLLNGWNRGDMSEEYLLVGLKEYAAEKKALRAEQTDAFYERLSKRNEKGTE
jgi:hypothetical protein